MCLDIGWRGAVPQLHTGTGYKVFHKGRSKQLKFSDRGLNGSSRVYTGRWLKAEKREVLGNDGKTYESGFHVYLEYPRVWNSWDDNYLIIRKVKYRKGRILGYQSGYKVIIADEMYVFPGPVR